MNTVDHVEDVGINWRIFVVLLVAYFRTPQ